MARRTTAEEVKEILGDNYDSVNCPRLTPFIDVANVMIDDVVTCAATKGITHSAAKLRQMERLLAAHYYTISDPLYKSKQTADASATFMDRSYLEAAKMLDNSGCLTAAVSGQRAGLTWLGKPPSEQYDYDERD